MRLHTGTGGASMPGSAIEDPRIHITGASGTGVSTLGRALAETLSVRFIDKDGDRILQHEFAAVQSTPGWAGSDAPYSFVARKEVLTVPENAEYLSVAVSSSGPAEAVAQRSAASPDDSEARYQLAAHQVVVNDIGALTPAEQAGGS